MASKKARSTLELEPTASDLDKLQMGERVLKEECVTFRLEKELKDQLRSLNIDISKACREYLRKLVKVASK